MSEKTKLRLLPPTTFVLCITSSIALHVVLPIGEIIRSPHNLFGLVLALLGVWILYRAHRMFVQLQTNVHTFRAPSIMVIDGPFRFTRNPMYLGFLTILLGTAIGLGNIVSLLPVVMFFCLANFWYIPFEEAACLETFGSDYECYRKRVRRWL